MSLKPIREEIDKIDEQLTELFVRRMECSKRVAEAVVFYYIGIKQSFTV